MNGNHGFGGGPRNYGGGFNGGFNGSFGDGNRSGFGGGAGGNSFGAPGPASGFGGAPGPGFQGFPTPPPAPMPGPPQKNGGGKKVAIGAAAAAVVVALVGAAALAFSAGDDSANADGDPGVDQAGVTTEAVPDGDAGSGSGDAEDSANIDSEDGADIPESDIPDADDDSAIFHDSEEWQFLSMPGAVVPGGIIVNDTDESSCSVGYVVSTDNRDFVLTAGHCGEEDDQFSIVDEDGSSTYIGSMVESEFLTAGGADYGLNDITRARPHVQTFPFDAPLKGWRDVSWLEENKPRICRLGFRTGLSCGEYLGVDDNGILSFRGIADHGDSGGPVFAQTDDGFYAVGLQSYGQPADATRVSAMTIAEPMNLWGLTLYA